MNEEILNISNLIKNFDNKVALENINLTINKGERVALIGSSGSGKSTLMNLITRTVKEDSGEIKIEGENISKIDNKKFAKKVGMLRQQFDLVENLTVLNNVLIGRFNEWNFWKSFISLFKPQDLDVAKTALRKIGLEEKLYEPTSSLSGGQQQRVAIARLLVQNPTLILADEPISSLDPVNAKNVLSLITKLAKDEHKTLLASMHSVEYSREFFDRIIGLKYGKIIFDGEPKEITEEMIKELYRVENNG